MIKIENVCKIVNKTEMILNNVSFEVNNNDFIVITGPSGSGKTTLINVIGGITDFNSGNYLFNEKNIKTNKDRLLLRKEEISFIVQDFALIDDITVKQNLRLVSKDNCDELLSKFNVLSLKQKLVKNLSGGEKQRVAIIRAILKDSDVIICDEPTGNLDSKNSSIVIEELQKLHQCGKTIILVTHEEYNVKYATKHLMLTDGELVN